MDDKISVKSSDSVTTSGEYEIVLDELEKETTPPLGTSPTLNIANNGNLNDLEKNLTEMIHELDQTNIHSAEVAHASHTDKGDYPLIRMFRFVFRRFGSHCQVITKHEEGF